MILAFALEFVILAFALEASPSEATQELSVELNIRRSFATKKNIATVMLINTGDTPVVVLSKGLDQGFDFSAPDHKSAFLDLQHSSSTWNGHKLVQSRCTYAPVALQPGEATQYGFFKEPFTDPFKRLGTYEKMESLAVKYTISEEDAKRYGTWAGSAESKRHKVVNGEIQNESVGD